MPTPPKPLAQQTQYLLLSIAKAAFATIDSALQLERLHAAAALGSPEREALFDGTLYTKSVAYDDFRTIKNSGGLLFAWHGPQLDTRAAGMAA